LEAGMAVRVYYRVEHQVALRVMAVTPAEAPAGPGQAGLRTAAARILEALRR
jgi:hypothetical protein